MTQQQIKLWDDDDKSCNDDELIEWYEGYKKCKAQKVKIKQELLLIAWHPDRVMGWCYDRRREEAVEVTYNRFLAI